MKRRVLVNDFSKGGINMVDVISIQKSFQFEWLIKLSKAKNLDKRAWVPAIYFSNFGKDMAFLNNNLDLKQFKGLDLVQGYYWKSCLRSWIEENKINTREVSITGSCLWNNQNIRYQNSVLLFSSWARKGITYVSDVMLNGRLMSFGEVENLIGRSVNLRFQYIVVYNSLINFFNSISVTSNTDDANKIFFNDQVIYTARVFKQYLYEAYYCTPTAVYFWRNRFNVEIDIRYWELAVNSTKESRLRELHFKIINNIYPTNILLFKINISPIQHCSFCINDRDYIEHFFYHCIRIYPIWYRVETLFYKKFSIAIKLNVIEALLGVPEKDDLTKPMLSYLNQLILIAKMCISKVRYGTQVDIVCLFEKECLLRKLYL